MKKMKLGLLPRIIIAIALGIVCGLFFPGWIVRIFLTVNSLFGNFLNFIIPLLILGLVAPGIADLGKGAGRLLLITALLAYGFTLFSGFFTYFTCDLSYPKAAIIAPPGTPGAATIAIPSIIINPANWAKFISIPLINMMAIEQATIFMVLPDR